MTKVWYNWPENYYKKDWLPWYSILRRLIAFPFAAIAFVLFLGIVVLGYGKEEATQILKDTFS